MNPLLAGPIIEWGGKMLDRLFPDPEKKAQAEREFTLMLGERSFREVLAQIEVNAKEAMHPSIWVAGWRPGVGWACAVGFVWATIGHPLAAWAAAIKGWPAPPQIDSELLIYVLGGLLGLGALRSFEKVKGVSK